MFRVEKYGHRCKRAELYSLYLVIGWNLEYQVHLFQERLSMSTFPKFHLFQYPRITFRILVQPLPGVLDYLFL